MTTEVIGDLRLVLVPESERATLTEAMALVTGELSRRNIAHELRRNPALTTTALTVPKVYRLKDYFIRDAYVPPVTISVASGGGTQVDIGLTLSLTATLSPADVSREEVVWSSSDEGIATVASTGATTATVTGVSAGAATITATAADGSGVYGTFAITVVTPP